MTTQTAHVNKATPPLPLSNVILFTELVERLINRSPELPGFGVFAGKAGLGKTFSAHFAINRYRAYYVECCYSWSQKAFCEAAMVELGLLPPRTPLTTPIYRAVAEIGDHLADHPTRPLIIDESDFLMQRRMIEIVRDIYKHCAGAGASIILIGEENMPNALKLWERIDSRILGRPTKAQSINTDDVATLAGAKCAHLDFDKAAIDALLKRSGGSARRLVNMLDDVRQVAGVNGWTEITAALLEGV